MKPQKDTKELSLQTGTTVTTKGNGSVSGWIVEDHGGNFVEVLTTDKGIIRVPRTEVKVTTERPKIETSDPKTNTPSLE